MVQSHLYGIERHVVTHALLVVMRFNRTFMELKARRTSINNSNTRVQSHLYGIESNVCWLLFWHWCRFNRTFMELKVLNDSARTPKYAEVQSHLYGIESYYSHKLSSLYFGFNRTFMELKGLSRSLSRPLTTRFNRTFMELKDGRRKYPNCPLPRVQSHLYGIESSANARHKRTACGSIAPLWN